ncbi:competence protein ComFB [filamentous cyanobacterium CCP5]|nr:competence protein ComFB [filamentous cyanobacterium CCP5]
MPVIQDSPKRGYVNVMELLVAEEVDRQLKQLSPKVSKYVKRFEVETYALNRLPPLYASSEKGWDHQYERAKQAHKTQISKSVMQAMAAVQVDPIRSSRPLSLGGDEAQTALKVLRDMLQQPDLSWEGIINRLKPLLGVSVSNAPASVGPPPAPESDEAHRSYWRPGTYGAEVSWKARHQGSGPEFDWSDSRYSK